MYVNKKQTVTLCLKKMKEIKLIKRDSIKIGRESRKVIGSEFTYTTLSQ